MAEILDLCFLFSAEWESNKCLNGGCVLSGFWIILVSMPMTGSVYFFKWDRQWNIQFLGDGKIVP